MNCRLMSTTDAANVLGLHPAVLRACAARFSFPAAHIVDGRRAFAADEVLALRAAMACGGSMPAAVSHAQHLVTGGGFPRAVA